MRPDQVRYLPARGRLFDGDALGQIAGLIDVAATAHRDVIGEQLQRHDLQNRLQQLAGRRDVNDMIGDLRHFVVTFRSQRDHDTLASLHFLNIRKCLLVPDLARFAPGVPRGDDDYGQIAVDRTLT